MKPFRPLAASFPFILLASLLGCASTATQESAGEFIDDTWITARVKASLVQDPDVRATEVNVETFKGVVQLSGFVSSDAAKDQAVRIAQSTRGVTSVHNDIRVR